MNKTFLFLPLLIWSCCEEPTQKPVTEVALPAGADLAELDSLLEELETPHLSEKKEGAIPESDQLTYQKALKSLGDSQSPAVYTKPKENEQDLMTFDKAKAALEEETADSQK